MGLTEVVPQPAHTSTVAQQFLAPTLSSSGDDQSGRSRCVRSRGERGLVIAPVDSSGVRRRSGRGVG